MKGLSFWLVVFSIIFIGCSKEDATPTGVLGPVDSLNTICKPLMVLHEDVRLSYSILQEWLYNSDGNETGYKYSIGGQLMEENKNYRHDQYGNVIYYESFSPNGAKTMSLTSTYLKYEKPLTRNIDYSGVLDVNVEEWTYNSDGNENGYKRSKNNVVTFENKNYQHDQYENVVYYESFEEGIPTYKFTRTFLGYNKRLTKQMEYVQTGQVRLVQWTYNSERFEIGIKNYLDKVLTSENKNYQHDEFGNVTYYEQIDAAGNVRHKKSSTFNCIEKK